MQEELVKKPVAAKLERIISLAEEMNDRLHKILSVPEYMHGRHNERFVSTNRNKQNSVQS